MVIVENGAIEEEGVIDLASLPFPSALMREAKKLKADTMEMELTDNGWFFNGDTFTTSYEDWMKDLDGKQKISAINIPGTHDSAATNDARNKYRYQTVMLKDQLKGGIRFVDIWLKSDGSMLEVWDHDDKEDQNKSFKDVQQDITDFLSAHKTETVVVKVSSADYFNGQTSVDTDFATEMSGEMADFMSHWYNETTIPKLDKVRGKMVLVRHYPDDDDLTGGIQWGGPYAPTTSMQLFVGDTSASDPSLLQMTNYMSTEDQQTMVKNACKSMQSDFDDKYMWFMQVSTSTSSKDGHMETANTMNEYYQTECVTSDKYMGIMMADYPGSTLIGDMIKSNPKHEQNPILKFLGGQTFRAIMSIAFGVIMLAVLITIQSIKCCCSKPKADA